ncbi:MAG: hypothetical protein WA991_03045 [Ornithinimicrobium sp.]
MEAHHLDNDVVFKLVRLGLLSELTEALHAPQIFVLSTCKYVAERALNDVPVELGQLREWLASATDLEVTSSVALLAAAIEERAIDAGLQLDDGESLLFAEVAANGGRAVTGDKRAIKACDFVVRRSDELEGLHGRVVCLEQIFLQLLSSIGVAKCRAAVCSAKLVDRALTACFHCTRASDSMEDAHAGLHSYVRALKAESEMVLADDACALC